MDSFFLAETCKYLYLLFDSDHWIRRGRYVFNTEGHPFALRPGRPNMTAARVEDWVATMDTWLGDEEAEADKKLYWELPRKTCTQIAPSMLKLKKQSKNEQTAHNDTA